MGMILVFLRKYWLEIAIILAVLAAIAYIHQRAYNRGQTEVQGKFDAHLAADKAATDKASAAYRAKEAKQAEALAEIGFRYEREKMDALNQKDAVIADLRDGTLKLRQQWRGCPAGVPAPAEGPGSPDDAADLLYSGAGDIVRVIDTCQSQVKGLQDVVRTDRGN